METTSENFATGARAMIFKEQPPSGGFFTGGDVTNFPRKEVNILKFSLQNTEFEITCPNCSNAIKVRFKDVGSSVVCSLCKREIHLQDNGFSQNARKAEQVISNLTKKLNSK